MSKILVLALAILLAGPLCGLAAQDSDEQQRVRDTIRYGIESQVTELLGSLRATNDDFYNQDLHGLFLSSRSANLRQAILEFFNHRKSPLAINEALNLVEQRYDQPNALVSAAFTYLITMEAEAAGAVAKEIITEKESAWYTQAVRLLSAIRAVDMAYDLAELYRDPESPTALREQILLALGRLPADESFELLSDILQRESASRIEQMYAATGLGQLGDSRALPALKAAVFANEPNVRARAIGALAEFDNPEVRSLLLEAMRDSHVTPRVAACKAIEKLGMTEAIPALEFRLKYDPERLVREAAISALAVINTRQALDILLSFVDDEKNTAAYRGQAFVALVQHGGNRHETGLKRLMQESMEARDRSFFTILARGVTSNDSKNNIPYIQLLLQDKEFTVRLGALGWIARYEVSELRSEVAALAETDPSDVVKRQAEQTLLRLSRGN